MLSPSDKSILKAFIDTHKDINSLRRDVPVCTVKKQYEKPKILVTVHVRQPAYAAWNVVKNFLANAGAHDLPGPAPRGPIFRGIAEELDRLMK